MASSLFDALGEDFESGGVEPAAAETGSPAAEDLGSPATTEGLDKVSEATPVAEEGQAQTGEVSVAPAQAPQEAPAQAAPAAQEQAVAQPQAAPQQQTPAEAQPASQQQQAPTPEAGTQFLEHMRAELQKSRETYEGALAQHYSMSEEEAAEVLTEPEKVLPKLAARVHLEVVQNVLGTLAQTLPGVVMGVTTARQQNDEMVGKFFEKWPTLDRKTDYGVVTELARLYRTQNPNASFEDMVQNVGAMAVVRLGKLPAAQAPASAPVAAQPQVGGGAYQPAARTPAFQPPAPQDTNPWAAYAELIDE